MRTSLSNNIALNLPASALDQPSPDAALAAPLQLSPRLHNSDLAPTRAEGRRWGKYSIFALWTNDVHNIANYSFAIGLYALGLGGWQILLSLGIGAALVYFFMNLSGYMGRKPGAVSGDQPDQFRHSRRADSGVDSRGDRHRLVRHSDVSGVGGISRAADGDSPRVRRLRPQLDSRPVNAGLGVLRGDLVRATGDPRLWHGNGPPLRSLCRAGDSADRRRARRVDVHPGQCDHRLVDPRPADRWRDVAQHLCRRRAVAGDLRHADPEFLRLRPLLAMPQNHQGRQFLGLPVNILVFAAITVLLCGAQFQINGRVIESPTEIIASIPNTFFLVLGCLAFLIVTVAVNIMANFVAPAFVLSNLAPKYLTFRRAGLISATIAVLILPWNLYNSPLVIVYSSQASAPCSARCTA